jgi:hypothetical protein
MTAVTKGGQKYYLFALDMAGAMGFDLENWQRTQTSPSLWRPGEKIFPQIGTDRVLAWVEVIKLGGDHTTGWKFEIAKDAKWSFEKMLPVAKRTYLIDELEPWRGVHQIPASDDFVRQ